MDPVSYILSLLPARLAVPALAAIGLCAVLDAMLPQPPSGSPWVLPRRILSAIGANWLNARNLAQPGAAHPVTMSEGGR
ncbi:hypothetical protein FHR90_002715 [Endobacter medicaginis]|jgi:hypothetical protein|uniref:Uncharacterized protein n=1 Tax=Endobacter medicaginis TaxID=1181271 RepID=A0A839UX11_9PROT|nr:hypothetical protein [Endobacter medicaginis]MBB3174868.1 hypothetical protein [Endobacter medicaginis]MCX5475600.1 hypothetical protein [Endobacter medicaginis]NVN30986.1 hypothetical protein [Endobacter medicaginis]